MNSGNPEEPSIVSPVMRHLGVVDAERSIAFYRDGLGFEPQTVAETYGVSALAAEGVRDPASIRFALRDDPSSKRGTTIVFFETNDIAALRDSVIARGRTPSELATVNSIKMEVFEVRDPDGNVLWFEQPLNQPDPPRQKGLLRKVMPELPFTDVAAGVAH